MWRQEGIGLALSFEYISDDHLDVKLFDSLSIYSEEIAFV